LNSELTTVDAEAEDDAKRLEEAEGDAKRLEGAEARIEAYEAICSV
jgi:hypothetical protein